MTGVQTCALPIFENQNNNCLALTATDNILKGFDVYPNPTKDTITVKNSSEILVTVYELYNTDGKIIAKSDPASKTSGDFKIDVSSFQDGIYFLKLFADDKTAIFKIIKEQ